MLFANMLRFGYMFNYFAVSDVKISVDIIVFAFCIHAGDLLCNYNGFFLQGPE